MEIFTIFSHLPPIWKKSGIFRETLNIIWKSGDTFLNYFFGNREFSLLNIKCQNMLSDEKISCIVYSVTWLLGFPNVFNWRFRKREFPFYIFSGKTRIGNSAKFYWESERLEFVLKVVKNWKMRIENFLGNIPDIYIYSDFLWDGVSHSIVCHIPLHYVTSWHKNIWNIDSSIFSWMLVISIFSVFFYIIFHY